jgi:hypothetical protein
MIDIDKLVVVLRSIAKARLEGSGRETWKFSPEIAQQNAIVGTLLSDIAIALEESGK